MLVRSELLKLLLKIILNFFKKDQTRNDNLYNECSAGTLTYNNKKAPSYFDGRKSTQTSSTFQ